MSAPIPNAPAVSVVVPVRNEAENVAPLVDEIAAALAGRAFEVIYVNDGSTDGTDAELKRLMAQHPWLRQVRHAHSCGQSAALRTGIAAARAPISESATKRLNAADALTIALRRNARLASRSGSRTSCGL